MKINKLALLFIPFLVACSTNNKEYDGEKITLEYVENGGLIETTPEELYNIAQTKLAGSVFLIGDESCSSCVTLKTSMEAWAYHYHAILYYLPIKNITTDNVHYLIDATPGYYQYEEGEEVPITYFFMMGEVALKGNEETTITYLNRYVTVLVKPA